MPIHQSWFSDLAFGPDAAGLCTVDYRAHRQLIADVHEAVAPPGGTSLIIGPEGAGKSTAVRELGASLATETAVAVIDGVRMNGRSLLTEALAQFGHEIEPDTTEDLLPLIARIAGRAGDEGKGPILIVDNADRLYPSGMRSLNQLATLDTGSQSALRLVLTGREGLRKLVASQLGAVGERLASEHEIQPMTSAEAVTYLHARLDACGVRPPDTVLPVKVCNALRERSGGWPGRLNAEAMAAIERATTFPVTLADTGRTGPHEMPYAGDPAAFGDTTLTATADTSGAPAEGDAGAVDDTPPADGPRIVVSRDGEVVESYTLNERKVLIGRSEFADVVIPDGFVSKLHAMLLLYRDALVLLDLNSANGLTVNSAVVSSTILRSGDVIMLGNHRLKVENAPVVSDEIAKVLQSGDTLRMKSLIDSRRRRLVKSRLKLVDS